MKCRYCARILRVIPHSPVEIEPHCERRGCVWCVECFRGLTSVSPTRIGGHAAVAEARDQAYRPKHRRPAPGPDVAGPWAA
jgi:hypothetical protein